MELFLRSAKKYRVGAKTVSRLWKKCPQSQHDGMVNFKEVVSKKHYRGRAVKWDREEVMKEIKTVPLMRRQTFHDLSEEMMMPRLTIHEMSKYEETLCQKKVLSQTKA